MKMNHLCGRLCACCSVFVIMAPTGCVSSDGQLPTQTDPQSADARPDASTTPDTSGEMIPLRTALLPPDSPHSVSIRLHEQRETTGEGFPRTVYSLDLQLYASLKRTRQTEEGEIEAELAFQRIVMKYGLVGRERHQFAYDSASDKPNSGNPLADLMQHVSDAVCYLRVGPSGRLRALHGLDPRWGRANLLMAPPALLTAQWTFRDVSMGELVAEALFPPMPASPVRQGDTWDVTVPANIPLVARIHSRLHSKLTHIEHNEKGQPIVSIIGVGQLSPAPDLIEGQTPAIYPTIKSASHKVTQTVIPATGAFAQQQQIELVAKITMKAPADDTSLTMTIQRKRVLESKRTPETPRTVMKDGANPSTGSVTRDALWVGLAEH